jgi:nitroreductase
MKTILLIGIITIAGQVFANGENIKLPEPDKHGGMPLMQAMAERQSGRNFSQEALSLQQLANICWAAWGINRPESGRRTAPSSRNRQEMQLFVVLADAVYIYNAEQHQLDFHMAGDLRAYCGSQDFVATAPLNLMYVADMEKLGLKSPNEIKGEQLMTPWANCGFMSQNVYLYCASEGLATVIRAMVDRDSLHKKLGLSPMQQVIMGQSVGRKVE